MQTFQPGVLGGSMRFCLAIVVGCALSSGAQAADLPAYPVRAPIYAAPAAFAAVYDWTGFYIGGNAGGGWHDNRSVTCWRPSLAGRLRSLSAPPPRWAARSTASTGNSTRIGSPASKPILISP